MIESLCFNNWNFREYSYVAGVEFCVLETEIPVGSAGVGEFGYLGKYSHFTFAHLY